MKVGVLGREAPLKIDFGGVPDNALGSPGAVPTGLFILFEVGCGLNWQ